MATEVRYLATQVSIFYHNTEIDSFDQGVMAEAVAGKYLPPVRLEGRDGYPLWVMVSENGNSQLLVTSSSIALHVTFSPQWQQKPKLGQEYVAERIPLLFAIISHLRHSSLIYAGSSLDVQITSDLGDLEIARAIEETYAGHFGNNLTDLFVRTSEVVDEDYYRNVTVQNFRTFVAGPQTPPQIRLKNDTASARGVAITVDFNSRYGYNEGRNTPVTLDSVAKAVESAYAASADMSKRISERMT